MATLTTLQVAVLRRLGTSAIDLYTPDKQTEALNRARKKILMEHNIEDFIRETTISFTSGVGTLPSNYLRRVNPENPKKRDLWNDSASTDYLKVSIARLDDEDSDTWTIDNTTGTKQVKIIDADTVTLNFRYIYLPDDMSDPSDDSGLPSYFDDAHALFAAVLLLKDEREIETAAVVEQYYKDELFLALSTEKKEKGNPALGTQERGVSRSNLDANNDLVL